MIRILVAGDQPLVRTGIRTILDHEAGLDVVGEAPESGPEVIEQSRTLRPDVVLVDAQTPAAPTLDSIRELVCREHPGEQAPRVLVLASFDCDDLLYATLHAGASGLLVKDCEPDELVRAVHAVAGHEAPLSPSIAKRLITSLITSGNRPDPAAPGVLDVLTSREREVLRLLVTGRSNAEIASFLFISEQTAKTHVRRVLNKLKLRDRVHAVVFGYENGVVVAGRPPS
ncbi:LuxR C-terminal-related transcriptional regulator [Actinoplanes sp. RD1]|uniref:LuxR C-terminal-related transcriptional regulator n=1 Tax=Actinoplanes sp. RD1 TaxID=3064538 RepID=UPI002740FF14|nr:response regulator transcription factor [Actinoplanes sp. RD1]